MTERERWAEQIRTQRVALDLKQEELAALLTQETGQAFTQKDISAFETRRREPSDEAKPVLIRLLTIAPAKVAPDWVRPILKDAA